MSALVLKKKHNLIKRERTRLDFSKILTSAKIGFAKKKGGGKAPLGPPPPGFDGYALCTMLYKNAVKNGIF